MTYFSRIDLDKRNTDAHRLAQMVCSNSYSEHQQLWQLFDSDANAERDFIYRREHDLNGLRYYVVSQRQPHTNNVLWHTESKPYRPMLREGQQLTFGLRVNPVVTKKSENGKSKRHDVVMDAKKKMDFKNMPKTGRPLLIDIVRDAGIEWLKTRAEKHGFSIKESMTQVDGYELQRGYKKQKNAKSIQYSTLDYTGVLTVTDPTLFKKSLIIGIGPAKAFGCGLLLVRLV